MKFAQTQSGASIVPARRDIFSLPINSHAWVSLYWKLGQMNGGDVVSDGGVLFVNDHSRGGGLISVEKLVGRDRDRERERNLFPLFAIRIKLIEPFRFPVVLCYRQSILLLALLNLPLDLLSFYICPGV